MRPTRRLTLAAFAALALGAGAGGAWAAATLRADDMVMGSPRARVTVVEYASVTCPHCAHWHETVYPAFKARYVDTGKVRYVFRELPTQPANAAYGGFLLARCAGKDGYFKVIADLMGDQDYLYSTRDGLGWLVRAGAKSGLSQDRVLACAGDAEAKAVMEARIAATTSADQVNSTPTFFVNGRRLESGELADLSAAIDPLLAGKR